MKIEELDRKKVLIIGGQHGDEPTGVEICKDLYSMRSAGNLFIIPCVNPIGYKAKTREQNGVDLNRSYSFCEDQRVSKTIDLVKGLCDIVDLVIDVHSTHEHMLDQPCFLVNEFGSDYVSCFEIIEHPGDAPEGSLRWYCDQIKTAMITYEAVEINPIREEQVTTGINEILKVLKKAGLN